MGRKPVISRSSLLEVAEAIVREGGAASLTIDALAKAAGISKGGVQYSFASKDELIRALVQRWTQQFNDMLDLQAATSPTELVNNYIEVTRRSQSALNAKMAGLMIGYIQDPENLIETRAWYHSVFQRLAGDSLEARAARVAFLAVEGLFLLRISGIDEDGQWSAFLSDVEAIFKTFLTTTR